MKKKIKLLATIFLLIFSICLGGIRPVTAQAANSSSVVNYALSTVGVNGWKGLCLGYVSHCFNTCYGVSSGACCAYAYGTNFLDSTSRTNIPLGTDVFFGGSNVTCGNHKAGHVGIYVGDDSIVHAWAGKIVKMKIDAVIRCGYPYRGWGWHGNVVLESGNAQVSQNPDDYQQVSQDLYFRAGNVMTGTQVGYVQAVLKYLGYNIVIDQSYGPATRDVMKQFQSDHGLAVDGSCGPQTRTKLIEVYQQRKNPTPSHETKVPEIRDIKVTDISKDGYTVSCRATDESGIDRVQFPTWTDYNGRDDILPNWETNPAVAGTRNGDVFTYRVNISDHNYEQGTYHTHIYAFDRYGNYDSDGTICVEVWEDAEQGNQSGSNVKAPVGNTPKKYSVTYQMNGGVNNSQNPGVFGSVTVYLKNPWRRGYQFTGWTANGQKLSSLGAHTLGNKVLTAQWEKIEVGKVSKARLHALGRKKIRVSFRRASGAEGYAISYSVNKNMRKSKTLYVPYGNGERVIRGLKRGRRYYVKVRGYQVDSAGYKVYGKYSKQVAVRLSK